MVSHFSQMAAWPLSLHGILRFPETRFPWRPPPHWPALDDAVGIATCLPGLVPLNNAAGRGRRFLVRSSAEDGPAKRWSCEDNEKWSKRGEKMDLLTADSLLLKIRPFLQFATDNFLPIAIVCGAVFGLTWPKVGQFAYHCGLSKWSASGIFIISGLSLQTEELEKALEKWPIVLFGLVSILLITPLASSFVLQVNLAPREFVKGMAIFCCVPTTLSAGVTLTQLAGGNSALALALTLISNLLGVFTVPFMISKLVADGEGVSVPTSSLLKSLVEILLIPLLVGKVFRKYGAGVADFIDRRRKQFSLLRSFFLILVPWMQVSCSRSLLLQVDAVNLVAVTCLAIFVHLVFLAWNAAAISMFYLYPGGDRLASRIPTIRTVILTSSQKTLPVALAVLGSLGGALGETGLLAVPCVAAHIMQVKSLILILLFQ
eukprot:c27250_g1_i2 orf=365-1657(+)